MAVLADLLHAAAGAVVSGVRRGRGVPTADASPPSSVCHRMESADTFRPSISVPPGSTRCYRMFSAWRVQTARLVAAAELEDWSDTATGRARRMEKAPGGARRRGAQRVVDSVHQRVFGGLLARLGSTHGHRQAQRGLAHAAHVAPAQSERALRPTRSSSSPVGHDNWSFDLQRHPDRV